MVPRTRGVTYLENLHGRIYVSMTRKGGRRGRRGGIVT